MVTKTLSFSTCLIFVLWKFVESRSLLKDPLRISNVRDYHNPLLRPDILCIALYSHFGITILVFSDVSCKILYWSYSQSSEWKLNFWENMKLFSFSIKLQFYPKGISEYVKIQSILDYLHISNRLYDRNW